MEEAQAWVREHKRLLDRYEGKLLREQEESDQLQETVNELFELGVDDIEGLAFEEYDPGEETSIDAIDEKFVEIRITDLPEMQAKFTELQEQIDGAMAEIKEGRVLSRKHREVVKNAISALTEVLKADSAGSREDEEREEGGEKEPEFAIEKDVAEKVDIKTIVEKMISSEKIKEGIELAIDKLRGKVR